MAKHPQPANTSILLGRPTNEFYCLYKAFKHRDLFLALVAAVTILGKALPVVMSNIAYTLSQTYISYLVCAGASIAILSVMTLTLAGSMFVRWPYLPVDPRTMAGTLYYFAADPDVAEGFAGLGHLQRAERNRRVEALGRRYSYGRIADQRGSGGRIKMGIIAG
jgi:fluoride exporter